MWVDMIAEDLQAAVGNIEGTDQNDWQWKCFNWNKLEEMPINQRLALKGEVSFLFNVKIQA